VLRELLRRVRGLSGFWRESRDASPQDGEEARLKVAEARGMAGGSWLGFDTDSEPRED